MSSKSWEIVAKMGSSTDLEFRVKAQSMEAAIQAFRTYVPGASEYEVVSVSQSIFL